MRRKRSSMSAVPLQTRLEASPFWIILLLVSSASNATSGMLRFKSRYPPRQSTQLLSLFRSTPGRGINTNQNISRSNQMQIGALQQHCHSCKFSRNASDDTRCLTTVVQLRKERESID